MLGSGGHTAELLPLTHALDLQRHPNRVYVVGATDTRSDTKVRELEAARPGTWSIVRIPRAREVGQSYITSVFTTLWATLHSFYVMFRVRPSLLLCNGPAICVPFCVAAIALRFVFGRRACKIVFTESGCRVDKLSLSGLIIYHLRLADGFFVQWERLKVQKQLSRAIYVGRTL